MRDNLDRWVATDLKAWRSRLGMTQVVAAEALGVHLHALKNWEGDKRPISLVIQRLAVAMERERKWSVDSAIMEAAWNYLGTVAACTEELAQTGGVSDRFKGPVSVAVRTLKKLNSGIPPSPNVTSRSRWLTVMAAKGMRWIETELALAVAAAELPEPLAVDARHVTLSEVASTILVGSSGTSLNSFPLVIEAYLVEDHG